MAVYERETRVNAPLEDVWAFHATTDGLEALTPEWLHLRVESVVGPDGTKDPEELVAGTRIRLSTQPFGVGPRQRWVSQITERRRDEGAAMFRDVMIDGPFPEWVHTHSFFADGDATVVHDRVYYELPLGPLNRIATPFSVVGFEPMFRHRHRRTRASLE